MHTRNCALSVIGLLFAASSFAATNSWTKTTSGYWEEPFWSLGHLPSASDEAIVVTNEGFKALAIGPSTSANYPASLQINDLYVDAPTNSQNLLLLNYAGLNVPLTTAMTHIGRDGSLLSYYSALRVNQFAVNGTATFAELAESQVGQAWIGTFRFGSMGAGTGSAELTLSNGLFSAFQIYVAEGVPGVFNQYGGLNQTRLLGIGGGGVYSLFDGMLNVTQSVNLEPSTQGSARLNIAGGIAEMTELESINDDPRAKGEVLVSGGTLRVTRLVANNAQFTQTAGRAEIGDIKFPFGNSFGRTSSGYTLSGGTLVSSNLLVGLDGSGQAFFFQSGGIHTNLTTIILSAPEGSNSASMYSLAHGLLVTPRIDIPGGYFAQNRGTNYAHRISITRRGVYAHVAGTTDDISTNRTQELVINDFGSYGMSAGAQLWTSNTTVQYGSPTFSVFLGHHYVERSLLIDSGGKYYLHSGTLGARFITLDGGGQLILTDGGGIITTNDTVFMRNSGTISVAYGDYQFGNLRVPGGGIIDFPTAGPNAIRFVHAGYTNGALNGELRIRHWTPGGDHLYVGNNPSAITPDQLSLTHFIDPEGYPPGTYAARATSSGEIVPVEYRPLGHARAENGNGLVLSWSDTTYALYSSTNVMGPYQQVFGATSPYTNSFSEPQQFFIVRPVPPPP